MQGSTLVVVCYLCCGQPRLDCPRCHGTGMDPNVASKLTVQNTPPRGEDCTPELHRQVSHA